MLQFAQRLVPLIGAAAVRADEPSTGVVVLTGISLVFGILVLLFLILLLEGKIFGSIENKKKEKAEAEKLKAQAQTAAPAAAPAPAPAAPAIDGSISPQVVAAIMGAVSAATDGEFTIQSIQMAGGPGQPAKNVYAVTSRRGRWGNAGVAQNTEPF